MNRNLKKFTIGAALVGVLALSAVAASAQPDRPGGGRPGRFGDRQGDRLIGDLVEIVVDETGLQARDIIQQMRETPGTSLAEVIEANGGDVEAVVDGTVEAITERVNARVADGTITQERADEILGNLEERVTDGLNGEGPARRFVEQRVRSGVLELAAEQTGLTREEIVAQVREGATLADVLTANGVDVNAFLDSAVEQASERFSQAVENGRITQEQLNERLANLREQLEARINGTVEADI